MGMTSGSGKETRSAINVTPLIDVLLVLLIIFMVIQPSAIHGLQALAPQPPKDYGAEVNPKTIVVQVLPDGNGGTTYKINEDVVPLADLESQLNEVFKARNDRIMFVKGAKDLDFGSVIPVIDGGHRAGIDTIGIITLGVEREP